MARKKRLGIYGGTFSPPHIGHVLAAEAFVKELDLDELLIVPAYIPPHKEYKGEASPGERFEMSKIAFSNISKATVSDIEIRRCGKSYTYLTLNELAGDEVELFLLCGTDMFLTLDRWVCFERIFELATICYVRREEDADLTEEIEKKCEEYTSKYSASVCKISNTVVDISSTELREEIKCSGNSKYLTDGVLKYIKYRGLYQ